ncbi:hypothetical protein HYQ46_005117 [Verticillium longisporum]|nr:hypothetical protein HYQ46_005117 [Verticillium longisporum]
MNIYLTQSVLLGSDSLFAQHGSSRTPKPPRRNSVARSINSATSPSSVDSAAAQNGSSSIGSQELELQKKRARDRKSQQAMRDRNKWAVHNLTEQVTMLTRAVEERSQQTAMLHARVATLEVENSQLRAQNAALQLSLMGRDASTTPSSALLIMRREPWETAPKNAPSTCLADEILQGFIASVRTGNFLSATGVMERAAAYSLKPKLCSLIEPDRSAEDDISNVVADIVRSYPEIETLPKQVAVFWNMALLLKWMVLLDQQSWDLMPEWLRPTASQRETPHAAWIERIPWPRAREYLIAHLDITLDDWAAPYSSSFDVSWTYDPSLVVIACIAPDSGNPELSINPVYDEHLRQLRNWTVGDVFRQQFPEISKLVDEDNAS